MKKSNRLGQALKFLFTKEGAEEFMSGIESDGIHMKVGQGEMEENENGAKRESNDGRGRWDLLPYEGMEEVTKWFEAGAKKYGERNWEKGISVKDCTNRMIRHAIKAGNGWMDEGPFAHYVAVIWNALVAITMIKRNPKANDHFRDLYLKELKIDDDESKKKKG